MNSDYKSALDKIHLEQEKKQEMKQLFRKNNMGRKIKFIKPAVAVAACMALVVGISQIGSNSATKTNGNGFSIMVNAQTLTPGDASIDDANGFDGGMCGDENDGDFSYSVEFPVSCKGTNIEKITYSIKGAVFQVTNPAGKNIIIDGTKVSKRLNVPGGYIGEADSKLDETGYDDFQYTSFTVDYKKQSDEKTYISIANNSKYLSKEQQNKLKNLDAFNGSLKEEYQVYSELYKNVEISCTVTYSDKTTEVKKIKVSPKIGKPSDLNSNDDYLKKEKENPEKDFDMVYTVYSIK